MLYSAAVSGQLPEIRGRNAAGSRSDQAPEVLPGQNGLELWYRLEFDGQQIGYESLNSSTESGENPQRTLFRRIRETHLKLKRFGRDLSLSTQLITEETQDGLLRSFSLQRTSADGSSLERRGTLRPDGTGFDLVEKVAGTEHREFLSCLVPPRSTNFSLWIASAYPASRQTWRVPVLFPETGTIVDVEVRRQNPEQLRLTDSSRVSTVRYEYWPSSQPESATQLWYSENRTAVRIEQPLLGQKLRMELTDAAGAMDAASNDSVDLQFHSLLPVKGSFPSDNFSDSVRLRIRVPAPGQIRIPTGDFQQSEQPRPGELLVTLKRAELPDRPGFANSSQERHAAADAIWLSGSRWIEKDHEAIRRMATLVAGGTSIPSEKCRRLAQHLFRKLRQSPLSTTLQPASEVVRSLRGDCTEHAVLLCSLLRNQQVPARVAVGLVSVPAPASFAPHMWTEVYLEGKWYPLDSTLSPQDDSRFYLKLTDSPLTDDTGSGTVLFLPLLSILGKSTAEVVR